MTKVYSIKKGPLSKNLVFFDEESKKYVTLKMPENSVVSVKVTKNCFFLFHGKRKITAYDFDRLWFDEKNPNILIVENDESHLKFKVDCLTGRNSPPYKKFIKDNYYIDSLDNLLKIDDDLISEKTGIKFLDTVDYIVQNENGKIFKLDKNTLKPTPLKFDEKTLADDKEFCL